MTVLRKIYLKGVVEQFLIANGRNPSEDTLLKICQKPNVLRKIIRDIRGKFSIDKAYSYYSQRKLKMFLSNSYR